MSYDLYEEDRFLSPSSSTPKKSPPSRHSLSRNRSNTSLRGGASSLAHELAVALLPEPTAGSKLLAEEFGIEYEEGAEGIDGMPPHDHSMPSFAISSDMDPSIPLEFDPAASGSSTPGVTDDDDVLDPTFHSPAPPPRARSQPPEVDAMALLSQNLESTEQFLTHLRRLDTDGPAPLTLEALAADIISRLKRTRVPAHRRRGRRRGRAGGPRRARGSRPAARRRTLLFLFFCTRARSRRRGAVLLARLGSRP